MIKYRIDVFAKGYIITYGDEDYQGWQCNSCCWFVSLPFGWEW